MYILGITGNIGSGKSTVSRMLEALGASVSHSDDLAKSLIIQDPDVREKICQRFGDDVYDRQGQLQNQLLAERAFATTEDQLALNAIVHPAVRRATLERIKAAEAAGKTLFIIDAPLLLEAGVDSITDSVLVVAANAATRQERIAQRSGMGAQDFKRRDALQMSIEEKLARADHVIWNDGDLASLRQAVQDFFQQLNL